MYQATNRPQQALTTLGRGMEVQQLNLRRVFAFSAEPAMRVYLDTVSHSLHALLSMVLDGAVADPAAAETALTWTLRRKAVILQALCRFRDAQRLLCKIRPWPSKPSNFAACGNASATGPSTPRRGPAQRPSGTR